MTKTSNVMSELVKNHKHPFPGVDNRHDKPHKSRYERRKIKEYLRLGNWVMEDSL